MPLPITPFSMFSIWTGFSALKLVIFSGVARGRGVGGKWGHAPCGAGLEGALSHLLQSFKSAF